MKKRVSILVLLAMLMQIFSVMPQFAAAEESTVFTVPDSPNTDYNFNIDWRFSKPYAATWPLAAAQSTTKDSNGKMFYDLDFDDGVWDTVSLPHTFNDEDSFRTTANDAGDGGIYRGIAFYRKHFTLSKEDAGKKVIVEFEGVRQAAYVYLNGNMVGYYEKGVSPFGIDLSKYFKFGEDNVIAVAVDNTSSRGMTELIAETKPGSTPGANDGVNFQWNTKDFNPVMGGLTRNAILHVKSSVYQTLPLYENLKTKGCYVYADNFNIVAKTASINVESEIRNESGNNKDVTVETVLVDKNGKTAGAVTSEVIQTKSATDTEKNYELSIIPIDAYSENPAPTDTDSLETVTVKTKIDGKNLRFWSPDDPYLYDIYTILKCDGEILDVTKTTTGFRKVEAKSGKEGGIFINDKYVWLTGYAQRSTNEWAAIGIANDWLKDYDAKLIKESNANFVRWMHIAAEPADIRSYDKYGIVCVQPAGDKEGDAKGRQWDQRVETMRDTMIYFRNSPSIIFWESGNSANSTEHMKEMTELRKTLDPNGNRFAGSRSIIEPETVAESEYVGVMLGRNVWNGKEFTENGIAARDARVIVETEYHREESPRRVWDDYSPPYFDYKNVYSGGSKVSYKDTYDLTAEDFVLSDAAAYNEFYSQSTQVNSENPFYSAAAALCWSDSNQHGRQQATENARMSGRVDPIRIKKQSFYAYQTMQSKTPSLYLVGHWNYPTDANEYKYEVKNEKYEYTGESALRDAKHKTVYAIASNVSSVKLFVNGNEKGECSEPKNGFIYEFPNIDITEQGYVEAAAYDENKKEIARQKIVTAGDAAQLKLSAVTGADGWMADGEDIAYIDVSITDENGNICPLASDRIDFDVSGDAEILGGYNSGVTDLNHSNNYVYAECGVNRVFLRAGRTSGTVTVTARCTGLKSNSINIEEKAFSVDNNNLTTIMPQKLPQGLSTSTPITEAKKQSMEVLADTFKVVFDQNTVIKENTKKNEGIKIFANNNEVISDAYKMIGVYGEIEPVLKALGVKYKIEGETLTAEYNGVTIVTSVKNSEMTVNGEPGIINDWPEIIDGKMYAEISAIVTNLGFNTKESEGKYEIWQ